MLYPDRIYQLAFELRKEKLWRILPDTALFAVRLPDGEIGYCNMMGALGEHLALCLYVGDRGFASYRRLMEREETDLGSLREQEILFGQECLQCAYENKDELSPRELAGVRAYAAAHQISFRGGHAFPQFMRYRPARFPTFISRQADIRRLSAALEAALEVGARLKTEGFEQLGFQEESLQADAIPLLTARADQKGEGGFDWGMQPLPPRRPERYPEPVLRDELLAARLKNGKKRAGAWMCDVVMLPVPYTPESGPAVPIFPYTLLVADCRTERLIPVDFVEDYESEAESLVRGLALQMRENGVPASLLTVNDRTFALLKNLAAQIHIRLARRPGNPFLEELEEDLMEHCAGPDPDEGPEELLTFLTELDDDALLSIPDGLWKQLYELERQGLLDEDAAERLRTLLKRRE